MSMTPARIGFCPLKHDGCQWRNGQPPCLLIVAINVSIFSLTLAVHPSLEAVTSVLEATLQRVPGRQLKLQAQGTITSVCCPGTHSQAWSQLVSSYSSCSGEQWGR